MALTAANVTTRLSASAATALGLSNKFYKVIQTLPSAVFEYTDFAEQILYMSTYLEQLTQVVPTLELPEGSKVFEDLTKLLDFTDDALTDSKEALPQAFCDGGEIDLLLPYEAESLLHQVEALVIASNMMLSVLMLGASEVNAEYIHPSTQMTEGFVNQVRRMVRTLKLSQPKEYSGRRGIAVKRGKTHREITEFLNQMLRGEREEPVEEKTAAKDDEGQDSTKTDEKEEAEKDKVNVVKFDTFGRDPVDDGMPPHIRHHPDQVYAKIHKKDVEKRVLDFHGLPWSMMKDDPNYFIIWKPMEIWECDNLFEHTKKLRLNEEQASIDAKVVVKTLLRRWANVEDEQSSAAADPQDEDMRRFDKDLKTLVEQDEKPKELPMPVIRRDRSFSPPPMRTRLPPPRRYSRHRELDTKTEYWRPWGEQTAQLFSSLKSRGWQPVYMRGTDAGQTWFYGQDVVHIRRFKDDYTPQDGPMKLEAGASTQEYLIISTEWIEEEALSRIGFQYERLSSGYLSLDPRITWGDIELLIGATSTFREERLYRKYRSLPGGDLHESRRVAVPTADFLHGPKLSELQAKTKELQAKTKELQAKNKEPPRRRVVPHNKSPERDTLAHRPPFVVEDISKPEAASVAEDTFSDAFVEVEK